MVSLATDYGRQERREGGGGGGHFNRECCLYQETGVLMTHSGECRTNHGVSLSGNNILAC